LSDATLPNGIVSNLIFENVDFDLLTIGNHELHRFKIAYEHFNQFSKSYGAKYMTSNVEIPNPSTGRYEYIGSQYRYFTTPRGQHLLRYYYSTNYFTGLRIITFRVHFDFNGSNATRITKASDMVTQQWFIDAVNYVKPIDIFVVLGHNPFRSSTALGTLDLVYREIRKMKPDIPIQIFGGHTHMRDFIYDDKATGLEAGMRLNGSSEEMLIFEVNTAKLLVGCP
jgi:2',3'-cyclic-nucleotide 2'-phosphodiesterase (5'-nucleotidase family)